MRYRPLLWFRPARPTAAMKVDALRRLAALLSSGEPLRAALIRWPLGAPDGIRHWLEASSRRAQLGAPLTESLASCAGLFEADQIALEIAVDLLYVSGADAAALIDSVAAEIARRELEVGGARAHAAGTRLSSRLIGGLPLVFVPLMPPGRAQLLDATGIGVLAAGLLFAVGGMHWIARLLPEPPGFDTGAQLASCIARCLQAGSHPTVALELCARRAGEDDDLTRAARRSRLGLPLRDALLYSEDDGLASVGRCLERAHVSGVPPAEALLLLAASRRAESERRFEAEMRRAPVKMVVPLTLCVLPSFVLLGLAPFLRGVTLGA